MAQEIADSKLIDTWSSSGLIVKPDISKIIEGWQLGEQPPHEYMNWLQNTFGSKLNHILKNGVASWNNETEYLAGSSVQHNGNVWLCKVDNTNSEPTDVNANWKRIITIEALENLLIGYVATNGNQTIDGIKTFSSSPIVPTPTTGTQAVNKDYVDNLKTIATGTATFNSVTNNINLTGIGIGVEIGDVIQISSATDAKNNSEFTIEVITDDNNIIVNQAHANKGTSKNVATRSGDTEVTVKLLTKWYNAPIGLGQGWVDVYSSRAISTNYTNPTRRTIYVIVFNEGEPANTTTIASLSVSGLTNSLFITTSVSATFTLLGTVPKDSTYIYYGPAAKFGWSELR